MLGVGNDKAEERCGEQEIMLLTAPGTKRAESNKTNREPQSVVVGHIHGGESPTQFQPLRSQALVGQRFLFLSRCVSPAPCVSLHHKKNIAL